ncbi:MAG: hypothetical protein ABI175_19185 [Polyangiales bacterium]
MSEHHKVMPLGPLPDGPPHSARVWSSGQSDFPGPSAEELFALTTGSSIGAPELREQRRVANAEPRGLLGIIGSGECEETIMRWRSDAWWIRAARVVGEAAATSDVAIQSMRGDDVALFIRCEHSYPNKSRVGGASFCRLDAFLHGAPPAREELGTRLQRWLVVHGWPPPTSLP